MRVMINALSAGNRSGTGRYAGELCRALAKLECDDHFLVVIEDDHPIVDELRASSRVTVIAQPKRSPLGRSLWEAFSLPALVRQTNVDVFHAPAFIAPSRLPCPSVVTIHDCAFLRYGETIRPLRRFMYRRAIPRSTRQAAIVLADSESTRRDVVELMAIDGNKARVAPLGVGEEFFIDEVSPEAEQRIRRLLQVDGNFILTAGTIEPRKNLDTLLRAYARLRETSDNTPPLVIVGRVGWLSDRLSSLTRELDVEKHVRFPGFIDDADLPSLLSMATVFVCVSLYEGFGLPPLEAMAAGTPVIVSNTSSLPEVVGDAGLLVEPTDAEAIAHAMSQLIGDPQRHERLAQSGRERARTFTWKRVAQDALSAYHDTLR